MLYICIHNDETKEIRYAEEWPNDTDAEKDWSIKNKERLELECRLLYPEIWIPYANEEKQFSFPKVTK